MSNTRVWIAGLALAAMACDRSPVDSTARHQGARTPGELANVLHAAANPACTHHWASAVNGLWFDPTKWNPAVVPGASDVACVDAAGTYTVTLDPTNDAVPVDVSAINVGGPTGVATLTLTGSLYTINVAQNVEIGATGTLSIAASVGGAVLAVSGAVVNQGTIVVSSTAGKIIRGDIDNQGAINIGGSGLIWDKVNGAYTNTGAISMPNAQITIPSTAGNPSFAMNGGSISGAANFSFLGMQAGTFTLNGGSVGALANARPAVQLNGASLVIAPTATAANLIAIAATASGTPSISGDVPANTTLWVTGPGTAVAGTLNYLGAPVVNGTLRLDAVNFQASSLTLAGSGILTNMGTILQVTQAIGMHYAIDVTNLGAWDIGNSTFAILDKPGGNYNNAGTITLAGAAELQVVGANLVNQTTGTIVGGTVVPDGGRVMGAGSISKLTPRNSGSVEPGFSPGVLTSTSFGPDATSILRIELGGTQAGTEYDQLVSSGQATFNGQLDVMEINGFISGVCGQVFDVVVHSSPGGSATFPTVNGLTPAAGRALRVVYANAISPKKVHVIGFDPTSKISLAPNPAAIAEGQAGVPYAICLDHAPTGNVTVTPTPDAQVTVAPSNLVFTTSNWQQPQFFTVTAVDDAVVEGNHTGSVTHAAASTDATFNGTPVPTLTANITDNDMAPNQPPTAGNDNATTPEDQAVTVSVLANDSDPDGDALTIVSVSTPTNGTTSIVNSATQVQYTPAGNYNGGDSFTYTISDGQGQQAMAIVNVIVTPVNDNPTAVDDNGNTSSPNAVVLSVLANDSDIDGDGLSVSAVTQPANGTAQISGGAQTVSYTPSGSFSGIDSFTYTVSDGNGGSAQATVMVTVAPPTNGPPNAVDDNANAVEDQASSISVLGNDSDPDGDVLTVTQVSAPAHGSAQIQGGQTVLYTPAQDYNGPDSFTYTISDGNGHTATATVNVTVQPVNDNPLAQNDVASTTAPNAVVVSVLTNDSDIDGDALTVSAVTQPANGSAAVSGGGQTVTYTPPANFTGQATFSYTASDGNGGTATAQVTITVSSAGSSADLAISVRARVVVDPQGAKIIYTITEANRGPNSSTGAVITVAPGVGLTLMPQVGCAVQAGTVSCMAGSLAPNMRRSTLRLVFRATGTGLRTSTFTVTGLLPDPVSSNNMVTNSTMVP